MEYRIAYEIQYWVPIQYRNARPESLREAAEDRCEFSNISSHDSGLQGINTDRRREPVHAYAQRGGPTKTRFETAQTTRCIVSAMGILIHSTSSLSYQIFTLGLFNPPSSRVWIRSSKVRTSSSWTSPKVAAMFRVNFERMISVWCVSSRFSNLKVYSG